MADSVIEIESLRKEFYRIRKGKKVAIESLDLSVPAGGVFGFLGRNGAGKTTTIRCVLGLAKITNGNVKLLGKPVPKHLPKVANRVGSLVESPAFVPTMTGYRNLSLLAALNGIGDGRVKEVLEQVGLATRSTDLVKTYSLGMKQRLGIAAALVKNPEVLILDEPANGLDPAGIREIRELIKGLGKEGRTVLVSSHLLSEVQQMCDRVAIIDSGRLVAAGSVDELLQESANDRMKLRVDDPARAMEVLSNAELSPELASDGYIYAACKADSAASLNRALAESGIWLSELTPEHVSLEELFIELTGGDAHREAGA